MPFAGISLPAVAMKANIGFAVELVRDYPALTEFGNRMLAVFCLGRFCRRWRLMSSSLFW